MKAIIKVNTILFLCTLFLVACSSTPLSEGNSAEYQKAKAKQAHKELASEISKIK